MGRVKSLIRQFILNSVLVTYVLIGLVLLGVASLFDTNPEDVFHGLPFRNWSYYGRLVPGLATTVAQIAGQYFRLSREWQYFFLPLWQILIYGLVGVILTLLFRKQVDIVQRGSFQSAYQPLQTHIKGFFINPFNLTTFVVAVVLALWIWFYGFFYNFTFVVVQATIYFVVGKCISWVIHTIIVLARRQKEKLSFNWHTFWMDWIALGFVCIGVGQIILLMIWHVINPAVVEAPTPIIEIALPTLSFQIVLFWLVVRINRLIAYCVFTKYLNRFFMGQTHHPWRSYLKRSKQMSPENKTWESVKQNYLQQVESALKSADHPQAKQILEDVSSHLDQKFAELKPDAYSWENFQKVIIEMGPPSDYAELLGTQTMEGKKKKRYRLLIASVAVILVVVIAGLALLFFTAPVAQPYFHEHFAQNISKLDVDTAKPADVTAIFGEPRAYRWDQQTFHKWNLPIRYIMVYPDDFRVFISEDKIVEVRYEGDGTGYVWNGKIHVGSSLDDVISAIGEPNEIVEGKKNFFEDGVLYKDIEGRKGYCYYGKQSDRIRMFFTKYKVIALYVTRSDYHDR